MSLLRRIEPGHDNNSNDGRHSSPQKKGKEDTNQNSLQARRSNAPVSSPQAGSYFDLKTRVQNKLLFELDPTMDIARTDEVRRTIQDLFEQILAEENIVLSRPERARLFEQIAAEILGFGPLQPLLEDDTIRGIMVNGPKNVYIERKGYLHRVPVTFETNGHVLRIIDHIVSPGSRRIDDSQPFQSAALLNGYSTIAIIPPVSLVGPLILIKKVPFEVRSPIYPPPKEIYEMYGSGNLKEFMEYETGRRLLSEIVGSDKNVMVISEAGVGKSSFISELLKVRGVDGAVVRLHNTLESNSSSSHILDLEAVLPSVDNEGGVSRKDLWLAALRIRPKLMVFETEDDDPFAILLSLMSMNTWTSISGRSPLQGLENFVHLIHNQIPRMSLSEIRSSIANSIDYVIFIQGHSRRWINSCDKLSYDRVRDEFILTSQLNVVTREVDALRERNPSQSRKKSGTFFQGILHQDSRRGQEEPSAFTIDDYLNAKMSFRIDRSTNFWKNIDYLLERPDVDHILVTGNAIVSSTAHRLKLEGGNNLPQNYWAELSVNVSDDLEEGRLPPYASLSSDHPAISRVEILTSALGSLEKNVCICKTRRLFPSLADLIKDFSVELQNRLLDAIKQGRSILISGLPDSGKTTSLNSFAEQIPPASHLTSLEYVSELRIKRWGLTTRLIQPTTFGKSSKIRRITSRVVLNLAPDYLILDGDSILPSGELLECLNTISVIQSITGKTAVHAIELLCFRFCSELNIDGAKARSIVANSFDMVLQVGRLNDGALKILEIVQLSQNGNIEKIRGGNFQDIVVDSPETRRQNEAHLTILSANGATIAENNPALVTPSRQTDDKNLLNMLVLSRDILTRQKSTILAKMEIQKLPVVTMAASSEGELHDLVDYLSFASCLPKRLFDFFTNPFAQSLVVETKEKTKYFFSDGNGIYHEGNLSSDESKILINQINSVLRNSQNVFVGSPSIGRVQYTPWLEIFWVFRPVTSSEMVWTIRKRPRYPIVIDGLSQYFEFETSVLNKLRTGLKNKLNMLVLGNLHNTPELVVESLINSNDDKGGFGIITDYGRIMTQDRPAFTIDALDYGNIEFDHFGPMISGLIDSPEAKTLALTAYPNTLYSLIGKTSHKRIMAASIALSKSIPTLNMLSASEDSSINLSNNLRSRFDLIFQIVGSAKDRPRVIWIP